MYWDIVSRLTLASETITLEPYVMRCKPSAVTAPFGFLRVAAACPPVSVADPARNAEQILRFVADARKQGVAGPRLPRARPHRLHRGRPLLQPDHPDRRGGEGARRLLEATAKDAMIVAVGLPACHEGRLFNVAAVIQKGRLLGVVPKTYLPGYKEYYEERWFASARDVAERRDPARRPERRLSARTSSSPSTASRRRRIAVEICEDLWAPIPPSSQHAVAGATVLAEPLRVQRAGGQGGVPPRAGEGPVRPRRCPPTSTRTTACTSPRPTSCSAASSSWPRTRRSSRRGGASPARAT